MVKEQCGKCGFSAVMCVVVHCSLVCEVMEDKEWQEGRLREEVSTLSKRIKEIEGELAQSREETSHLMSTVS